MLRKPKGSSPKNRQYYRLLNFHVGPDLDRRISNAAAREGLTVSAFIRHACSSALAINEAIEVCASSADKPAL
jgi:hypothetical protein